jgi:hypothetical protein
MAIRARLSKRLAAALQSLHEESAGAQCSDLSLDMKSIAQAALLSEWEDDGGTTEPAQIFNCPLT